MLKILIIDDEPPARARLRRLLRPIPDCTVIGEAGSGEEALERIASDCPDMLLLDISMPGLDGMSLARRIRQQAPAPAVVFCTAWPDQALAAFDCDAVDYLVKPVRPERLQAALGKVQRMHGRGTGAAEEVFLRSTVGGKTTLVALRDVICLLAEDKYTTVVSKAGKTVINDSLVELERRFPDRLLRIHRNALVAPDFIRGLDSVAGGGARLVLEGTDVCPEVSRRKLSTIRQILREMG
jgi:two-component system response regulator AlgR